MKTSAREIKMQLEFISHLIKDIEAGNVQAIALSCRTRSEDLPVVQGIYRGVLSAWEIIGLCEDLKVTALDGVKRGSRIEGPKIGDMPAAKL